jgi:hypothetical protein
MEEGANTETHFFSIGTEQVVYLKGKHLNPSGDFTDKRGQFSIPLYFKYLCQSNKYECNTASEITCWTTLIYFINS